METWTTSEGLVNDNTRAVMEDSRGRVWIGTGAGVSLLEKGLVRGIRLSPEWSRDAVRSFLETREGEVWVGADTGLFRWRDGEVKQISARLTHVRALLQDREGRVWAASAQGLWWIDGERAKEARLLRAVP